MLHLYEPSIADDERLLVWYLNLQRSGEIPQLIGREDEGLSSWYRTWQVPTSLCYEMDDVGCIKLAVWFQPSLGGAITGCWIAEGYRQTRGALTALIQAWQHALTQWPVLVATTSQIAVARQLDRLGWARGIPIPGLFQGSTAYILHLTQEAFAQRYGRQGTNGAQRHQPGA